MVIAHFFSAVTKSEMQNVGTVESQLVQETASSVGFTSGMSHSSLGDEADEHYSDPATSANVPPVSTSASAPPSGESILEDQLSLFRNSGELDIALCVVILPKASYTQLKNI